MAAFGTDLLWRVCRTWGRSPAPLSEFVTRGQELSVVRSTDVAVGAFRRALEDILLYLDHPHFLLQPL